MTNEWEGICRRYAGRWRGSVDGRTRPTALWTTSRAPAPINRAVTSHNEAETTCSTSGRMSTPLANCSRYILLKLSLKFCQQNYQCVTVLLYDVFYRLPCDYWLCLLLDVYLSVSDRVDVFFYFMCGLSLCTVVA